jgi:hypothetical protein
MKTFKVYRYDVSLDYWVGVAFNTTDPSHKGAKDVAAMFDAMFPTQLHKVVADNNSVAFSSTMLVNRYMMLALETSSRLRTDLKMADVAATDLCAEVRSARRLTVLAAVALLALGFVAAVTPYQATKLDDALKATIVTQDSTLAMCTKTLAVTTELGRLDASLASSYRAESRLLQAQLAAANDDVETCWTIASGNVELAEDVVDED